LGKERRPYQASNFNFPYQIFNKSLPFYLKAFKLGDYLGFNTKALNFFTSHCEPEGRGNLVLARDYFVASLIAMTGYLLRML